MIRVGIAEDYDLVRQGIVRVINSFRGIKVVLETTNGKEICDQIKTGEEVDVVLLDLEMPVMDGYDTAEYLNQFENIAILALSQHSLDRYIVHFIEKGGDGFLLKNVSEEELERAIRKVAANGYYINDNVSFKMLKGLRNKYRYKPGFGPALLTDNERDVLLLMCQGLSSLEIADKLQKSARTVENHRQIMMEKLEVKNSIQLVVAALQRELILLEEL